MEPGLTGSHLNTAAITDVSDWPKPSRSSSPVFSLSLWYTSGLKGSPATEVWWIKLKS